MGVREQIVAVLAHGTELEGSLAVPDAASGLVVFVQGTSGNRQSPRSRHVAGVLQGAGLATLLVDLLTASEKEVNRRTGHLRFDTALLADRLVGVIHWLLADPRTRGLPVGIFGTSTGAAAALLAAAREPRRVSALVSRGGRPDLAGEEIARVRAPTLLVVGGADTHVFGFNLEALRALRKGGEGDCELEIIPGAGHLFEEPGALERVAELSSSWFARYLAAAERPRMESETDGRP